MDYLYLRPPILKIRYAWRTLKKKKKKNRNYTKRLKIQITISRIKLFYYAYHSGTLHVDRNKACDNSDESTLKCYRGGDP